MENSVAKFLTVREQIEHNEALKLLMNCDAVLLFIASSTGKGILTGKIFEYLRSGKPILAMIPADGEAAEILKQGNHEHICAMEDASSIEANFLKIYQSVKDQEKVEKEIPKGFSRENQTRQFVEFLEQRL